MYVEKWMCQKHWIAIRDSKVERHIEAFKTMESAIGSRPHGGLHMQAK